jgi:2-iminobutanoate/2-iminopropanoate deaminase
MHSRVTMLFSMALVALVTTAGSLTAQERRYVLPTMASDTTTFPYSGGAFVGNTLYLSGTVGLLPGAKVPDTATEEAQRVLDNIKQVLTDAGMTMDDLVSVQVFCSDLSTYADFNKVYRTYFTKEYPARAFVGVARVLAGARFEVQGIAVKR